VVDVLAVGSEARLRTVAVTTAGSRLSRRV
jgi:hypothetical protein